MTALMAWPNFHREMEGEVDNQVAAPAETRTPNLHRANKSLTKSADGRVATGLVGARSMNRAKTNNTVRLLPFLPDGMVTERSSPSRVRYAAKNAPLTAPGRSAHPPARKEREILGMANQKQIKIYLTRTGLLMEGHYAHPMKEDVKKKDFSPPLGEMRVW